MKTLNEQHFKYIESRSSILEELPNELCRRLLGGHPKGLRCKIFFTRANNTGAINILMNKSYKRCANLLLFSVRLYVARRFILLLFKQLQFLADFRSHLFAWGGSWTNLQRLPIPTALGSTAVRLQRTIWFVARIVLYARRSGGSATVWSLITCWHGFGIETVIG